MQSIGFVFVRIRPCYQLTDFPMMRERNASMAFAIPWEEGKLLSEKLVFKSKKKEKSCQIKSELVSSV